jgi:uncharacterized protein (TIGR03435 family)
MRTMSGVAVFLAVCRLTFGQAADSKLTFEVASLKPASPPVPGAGGGMRGGPGTADPGRVTFPRATLADLVTIAYDVWSDQITGPDWITNRGEDVYTVTATMPPTTTMDQFRLMLQNLLAERFHLVLHHETQTRAGYELVVANGGPKIKEWTPVADAPPSKHAFTMFTPGRPAPIRMTIRDSMAGFCRGLGANINMSNGMPMGSPQPRVVDRTRLTGIYEFTLEFAGTVVMSGAMPSAPRGGETGAPVASDPGDGTPNIFTAVEKQLGLKLQKIKNVSVDVLIVDRADRVPTEN